MDRYSHSKYLLIRQWGKLFGANFRIFSPGGDLLFFVQQKAFKMKEDIRVFGDEKMTTEVFRIQARQIVDFSAAYDVIDSVSNQKMGALKRKGWSSIIRDEWIVMDAQDMEVGKIIEDNMLLALVRRFLSKWVPQSFDLVVQGQKVCDLHQQFNPFVFKMNVDFAANYDRHMGLAAAILIAAVEGRQQ